MYDLEETHPKTGTKNKKGGVNMVTYREKWNMFCTCQQGTVLLEKANLVLPMLVDGGYICL